jgi:hypothetical protein
MRQKNGPYYVEIPLALANRWKGTQKAHKRTYPSVFIIGLLRQKTRTFRYLEMILGKGFLNK